MKKIYDNLFFTRMTIRFIKSKKLSKVVHKNEYQIIEVITDLEWKQDHILFATHLTPINFWTEYSKKISKDKKVIIFGDWRRNAKYYRFLNNLGYKVFLIKDQNWNQVKMLYQ